MYAISAPAENALSPSPVRITTLTESSDSISLNTLMISLATSMFIALSLSGLFILMIQIPSDFETLTRDIVRFQTSEEIKPCLLCVFPIDEELKQPLPSFLCHQRLEPGVSQ